MADDSLRFMQPPAACMLKLYFLKECQPRRALKAKAELNFPEAAGRVNRRRGDR